MKKRKKLTTEEELDLLLRELDSIHLTKSTLVD